jgi:hypothetical protein
VAVAKSSDFLRVTSVMSTKPQLGLSPLSCASAFATSPLAPAKRGQTGGAIRPNVMPLMRKWSTTCALGWRH